MEFNLGALARARTKLNEKQRGLAGVEARREQCLKAGKLMDAAGFAVLADAWEKRVELAQKVVRELEAPVSGPDILARLGIGN